MSQRPASEFLRVAELVLEQERRPMSARAIVDRGLQQGLFTDRLSGKTPWQTMKSKLSQHIRQHGDLSPFVRSAPGRFTLRTLIDPSGVYHAPPLTKPASQEVVLVFPTAEIERLGRFHGIRPHWRRYLSRLIASSGGSGMERIAAESSDSHKQVLTYILVTRRGHVLAFKRGVYSRVEAELRGAQCIGFGGHVQVQDETLFSAGDVGLQESAARELREELDMPPADARRLSGGQPALEIIGLLNDDSSPVGRRHVAVVMRYEVSDDPRWDEPSRGEKSITQLRWIDPTSPLSLRDFEYWSQLCIRQYFPQVVPEPEFVIRRRAGLRPPHVVVLLGELGSGKTEAATILSEEFGYSIVNSGAVVSELLGLPPVPETPRDTFQSAAEAFIRKTNAPDRLAKALLRKPSEESGDSWIIEGVRQRTTLEALKRMVQVRLGVVYIHTPPDVAHRFFVQREGELPATSFFDLREADVEREVVSLIGDADAILYNWHGRNRFRQMVLRFAREVGIA